MRRRSESTTPATAARTELDEATRDAVLEDDAGYYQGTRLTITAGREGYAPVPFHTFEVGPLSIDIVVGPNETLRQAHARGQKIVDDLLGQYFDKSLARYLDRVAQARDVARARGFSTDRK